MVGDVFVYSAPLVEDSGVVTVNFVYTVHLVTQTLGSKWIKCRLNVSSIKLSDQIWAQSGSDWPKMGQIWNFSDQISVYVMI